MTQRATTHVRAPAGGDVSPHASRPHLFTAQLSVSSRTARQLPRRFLLFAAGGFSFIASTVAAQSPCAPREAITARLSDHYGEARTAYGIAANGTLMELWTNPETGSWPISATTAQGITCLIATGGDFGQIAAATPPKGDPL